MSYSAVIDKVLTYCFDRFNWARGSYLFKQGMYAYAALQIMYWLFDYQALFTDSTYIFRQAKAFSGVHDLPFILYSHPYLASTVLPAAALICIAGLLQYSFIISDLVLWFFILNIHYALYPGINGGHYLENQLLLFSAFIRPNAIGKFTLPLQWRNFLHNLGAVSVQVQVCLLYIVAALAKLGDTSWQEGTAIWQTGLVRHFTWDSQVLFVQHNWWTALLNYAVLLYQVSFPFLIWVPKIKRLLLICGFAIYLYIGLFMGLVSFAGIMILAHVYFWPWKTRQS